MHSQLETLAARNLQRKIVIQQQPITVNASANLDTVESTVKKVKLGNLPIPVFFGRNHETIRWLVMLDF